MFPIDATAIDKSLPVPVGTQLHGLMSYALAFGDIPHGTKLPSVRHLAGDLGIAPMTVAEVYKKLRDAGLVEMRPGLGAYSVLGAHQKNRAALPIDELRDDIARLIDKAEARGLSTMSLVSMINAQARLPRHDAALDIVFVCIFEGPGRDYVEELRPMFLQGDHIRLVPLDTLAKSAEWRKRCADADLVLTFRHREAEVRTLVPAGNVLGLHFIPSQMTRQNLAGLDPRTRVAAVTHFKEYIAIMRPSVREFAPHVSDITVTWSSAPDLRETLSRCDAVIFASGADEVAELAAPGIPCFEYRHAPDPGHIESALTPQLALLRRQRAQSETADPRNPPKKVAG
ncbi:GntR family transcriptional regulator [Martelella endophytica]|uniref:GntR family transcriptional regulator n=1 Tax=Martelella endophytica TaxID=1486262 RepID=A0A0D5LL90_MAREN|nr:GntR family transcriptional regulator [Martelella endophytica]AJY44949.1 GntR family transcriptional regulator [Martelella endophytica]